MEAHRSPYGTLLALAWPPDRIEVFKDVGCSGLKPFDDRLEGARLVQAIRADRIGLLAISDAARISRSPEQLAQFLALCLEHNVRVLCDGRLEDLYFAGFIAGCNVALVAGRRRGRRPR